MFADPTEDEHAAEAVQKIQLEDRQARQDPFVEAVGQAPQDRCQDSQAESEEVDGSLSGLHAA
jgi:hypothetical protein